MTGARPWLERDQWAEELGAPQEVWIVFPIEEEVEVGFVVLMGEDLGSSEIMDVEIVRP